MDTASFVIPSPKTILNKSGSYSKLIRDIAAMTSDEQRRLHISKHSELVSYKSLHSPVLPLTYLRIPESLTRIVKQA